MGTGIFLALHYTSDLNSAYFSLFFLIREVLYGWCLRYFHSSGASFVFLFLFLLLNGYSIHGLCLTFWTNEFLGGYSNYKFIISFSIFNRMGFWRILCSQSNIEEVLYFSFYTPISSLWFFPFILIKDFFGLILVLSLYFLQTHFGVSSLSHPDNALEACALLTPLHIVPEWYFLCQYAMLKA